ncbi:hypothetical protein QAD02_010036 [Eretmocerus hayati]|uniref:Uncharacterized protein n=1 Tax=Eretmocerus hayati TaxID=131215 RepID=A0ACC2NC74_9HYME|nr:hypothetical protein QAD02_010036 [Eretmocerus hayati]
MPQKIFDDGIVISGMAGRFPESENIEQLRQNLLNRVDMITNDDRRWKLEHPLIPKYVGKISHLEKFDARFFGAPDKPTNLTDPMGRMLLEHAYEAILDAGMNPRQLRGKKIGVFIGIGSSETEATMMWEKYEDDGRAACFSRSQYANRISYCFGFTGPSYGVDTACSSSMTAFEHAFRAIKSGLCDGAIVGGASICLLPQMNKWFNLTGVLSPDGQCKTWDEASDGFVRSESVCVVLLQKTKDARRIYATVINARSNCDGFKPEGNAHPSSKMQAELIKECYEECNLSPSCVKYVEAHGTGTKAGDASEIQSIDQNFCQNQERSEPLLIGSVKSNLGHTEAASGTVSMIKVMLGMESDVIFPNLHFNTPRSELTPITEGRIKVVTEAVPWESGYVGISSFGIGGSNGHVILKSHDKKKVNGGAPSDDLPRLVAVSGRTEAAVNLLLDDLQKKQIDVEYVKLLHDIHTHGINGHMFRGYVLLDQKTESKDQLRVVKPFDEGKKPIWFVFSGVGSQWPGMGEALLKLPMFAESVSKCDAILKEHGVDIYDILTNKEEATINNTLNLTVGITVMQIGLVDILYSLGIRPDNMIGHSLGENGCAYADGTLTLEQAVLAAYYRGLVLTETELIKGSMAAVGLGYNDLKSMCPEDCVVACHNSATSSTVSGPSESVEAFLLTLKEKDIFAKKVDTNNIPYHSRYIEPVGSKFLAFMKKLIPHPICRSDKWMSTSAPKEEWDSLQAQFSSAEYFMNNVLNPVLFEEVLELVPTDAIVIEIAPHGILQAILKRALNPPVSHISLTRRGHENPLKFFFQSIGDLYNLGVQPELAKLYPEVKYPVSRGTQSISPLVKWEHSSDWRVYKYDFRQNNSAGERFLPVSLREMEYSSLAGHVVDGRNLFPTTAFLKFVWETFAMMQDKHFSKTPVLFKDVRVLRGVNIPKDGEVLLRININIGTGRFEVTEGKIVVITGFIFDTTHPEARRFDHLPPNDDEEVLKTDDIYKRHKLNGCDYSGKFRSIKSCDITGMKGHITWHDDWIPFLDCILHLTIICTDIRQICVPNTFESIFIDPEIHPDLAELTGEDKDYPVYVDNSRNIITCGGAQVRGFEATFINPRKSPYVPFLEEYKFVPLLDMGEMETTDIIRTVSQIALENQSSTHLKIAEIMKESDKISTSDVMAHSFLQAYHDIPAAHAYVTIVSEREDFKEADGLGKCQIVDPKDMETLTDMSLIAGYGLLENDQSERLNLLISKLEPRGFLLTCEKLADQDFESKAEAHKLDVIVKKRSGDNVYVFFRRQVGMAEKYSVIRIDSQNFAWVDEMRTIMTELLKEKNFENSRVLFLGEGDSESGLLGLITCLSKEPGGSIVRGILIQDPKAEKFHLDSPFYMEHLEKDLTLSVLRENGVWGTYRHLPLPQEETKKVHHAIADQSFQADLSTLGWVEGPITNDFKSKDLVHVVYSSLNFRDIMLATGKLPKEFSDSDGVLRETHLGTEFSGYKSSGEKVMGIAKTTSFTNLLVADPIATIPIPRDWTLEDAATILTAYATAYYALYIRGNLQKGEKILIHAGSGAVGQAAIKLALYEDCEIFTTVGTLEKRTFIKENYPRIADDHIGNSRTIEFADMVLKQTENRGVDVVLNCLTEDKLKASVECLACGGRFLEIGKYDAYANNQIGLRMLLKDVSMHGVMLDRYIYESDENMKILLGYISKGIETGAVQPLVRSVFPKKDIEAAFRHMATAKHIGKVLVRIQDDEDPIDAPIEAIPRYNCIGDRSYIIVGGLGGIGLELVDWMTYRGAKNIVILSRSGVRYGYQRLKLNKWERNGIRIMIITDKDASNYEDCKFIIDAANQLGPVDGIFNLAAALKDGTWENQNAESFGLAFPCKAWATKNLDILSRTMCPLLRHFVIFSSATNGKGHIGVSNYGMANSVMEKICEKRASEGLPALAIQWGPVEDVGIISYIHETARNLVAEAGYVLQSISSMFKELDRIISQDRTIVSCLILSEKKSNIVMAATPVETILNIMGIKSLTGISLTTPLSEMGMDSLTAMEIKQALERFYGIFLNVQDLRTLTFKDIQKMSGDKLTNGAKTDSTSTKRSTDQEKNPIMSSLKDILLGTGSTDTGIRYELIQMNKVKGREVFLIPGIEGFSFKFSDLAEKLKTSATCLQLGFETDVSSIEDMSSQFLQHVHDRSRSKGKFVLIGYSFGALVAIELARSLGKMGLTGELLLIDGSPEYLKRMILMDADNLSDHELQDHILSYTSSLSSPEKHPQFAEALEGFKEWDDKIQAYSDIFPGASRGASMEFQKGLLQALYIRHKAALSYDVASMAKIRTPITLIKPSIHSIQMDKVDYGLSEVTEGKICILQADGDHSTMLEDIKIADVINKIAQSVLS